MTGAENSDDRSARAARRAGQTQAATDSAAIASQVGQATGQLGSHLADPAVAHTVEEIEQITRGFSEAADGMARGLGGITEWLRATGHPVPLSGHSSVVADRVLHAGRELTRLAEALARAERDDQAG